MDVPVGTQHSGKQSTRKLYEHSMRRCARGGVNVTILGDASGDRDARYATLDWDSLRQIVHGKIPQPKAD